MEKFTTELMQDIVVLTATDKVFLKTALEMMQELRNNPQYMEIDHIKADNILCNVLKALGQEELVNEFDKIKKWYA